MVLVFRLTAEICKILPFSTSYDSIGCQEETSWHVFSRCHIPAWELDLQNPKTYQCTDIHANTQACKIKNKVSLKRGLRGHFEPLDLGAGDYFCKGPRVLYEPCANRVKYWRGKTSGECLQKQGNWDTRSLLTCNWRQLKLTKKKMAHLILMHITLRETLCPNQDASVP